MTIVADMLKQLLPVIGAAADVRLATRRALADAAEELNRRRVYLLAIGKASLEMASEACDCLGDRVVAGIVTAVPERTAFATLPARVAVHAADHPLPTARNLDAAARVAQFVESVPSGGMLLVLISGGGSAHLTLPAETLTLDDLRGVTRSLQRAGATIDELNAVRKHCERLKGGRLAGPRQPGVETLVLVVSDVIGDRLDVISSGPFAADASTYSDAMGVLDRCGVLADSPAVAAHLERGASGQLAETPRAGDASLRAITHRIIAGNAGVVRACHEHLLGACDFLACRDRVVGEASAIGMELVSLLQDARGRRLGRPAVVILGGEWTVKVGATPGVGGPSQELALAAAIGIRAMPGAGVLAYSTDGIDGPTTAAGAVVDSGTSDLIHSAGGDPLEALQAHDSHAALALASSLIVTGPTGTNVNHIAIGLVLPA